MTLGQAVAQPVTQSPMISGRGRKSILLFDTFNDSNNTKLPAHEPNTDVVGTGWEYGIGDDANDTDAYLTIKDSNGIVGARNSLVATGGTYPWSSPNCLIDVGASDYTLRLKVHINGYAGYSMWALVRVDRATKTGYCARYRGATSGNAYLDIVEMAPGQIVRSQIPMAGFHPLGTDEVVRITMSGSQLYAELETAGISGDYALATANPSSSLVGVLTGANHTWWPATLIEVSK